MAPSKSTAIPSSGTRNSAVACSASSTHILLEDATPPTAVAGAALPPSLNKAQLPFRPLEGANDNGEFHAPREKLCGTSPLISPHPRIRPSASPHASVQIHDNAVNAAATALLDAIRGSPIAQSGTRRVSQYRPSAAPPPPPPPDATAPRRCPLESPRSPAEAAVAAAAAAARGTYPSAPMRREAKQPKAGEAMHPRRRLRASATTAVEAAAVVSSSQRRLPPLPRPSSQANYARGAGGRRRRNPTGPTAQWWRRECPRMSTPCWR